jgi:hypothetical protein
MNLPPNRARWDKKWLELFEERAGIIEFMSNVSRETAEFRAEADVRRIAAREEHATHGAL